VRVWHYLPARWNAAAAVDMYHGPIIKALRKFRGKKAGYATIEDNDPTGYKSNKGVAAKDELKIKPLEFPRYSPDLNPLDYFLWAEVERRMQASRITRRESRDAYMARLRRTALAIPKAVITKAVAQLKRRSAEIVDAEGESISTAVGRPGVFSQIQIDREAG
jgi:hypothetical protein